MTEYLIILAVVAIACITIFALFGKQIKGTISNVIAAIQGKTTTQSAGDTKDKVTADTIPAATTSGTVAP